MSLGRGRLARASRPSFAGPDEVDSVMVVRKTPHTPLDQALHHVAELLPAQGPISVFIHHNPLHAFEDLPFEEAVVAAAQRFGCEPYLSEERYRDKFARGRIAERDVDAVLLADLGEKAEEVVGSTTRFELRRRILLHGLSADRGPGLDWILDETDPLGDPALWSTVVEAVSDTPSVPVAPEKLVRHRDLLLSQGVDTDEEVHPLLIRFTSAFLDQGLADWAMPGRDGGLYACFCAAFGSWAGRRAAGSGDEIARLVAAESEYGGSAHRSLEASLRALGVEEEEWEEFLVASALALRGWAGMVRQIEERPDRVPAGAVPARLVDFLAVRLLLERAAISCAAQPLGLGGELRTLRERLRATAQAPRPATVRERAWILYQVAQLLDSAPVGSFVEEIEREVREFDSIARRRTWHGAYERHLRHRFYEALAEPPPSAAEPPEFQAIFCIDEREESFRRHLEEVAPECETLGAAGFFGVAIYYKGPRDAHPRPLCPVVIRPRHFVPEAPVERSSARARARELRDTSVGAVGEAVQSGSTSLVRGTVVMSVLGVLALVPLVLRVVFPWAAPAMARWTRRLVSEPPTRLEVHHSEADSGSELQVGFTVDEMAEIVRSLLQNVGLGSRLAPLVLVVGHGSSSFNNPHESAYDCGACGGGHGGPNARAFALMANDPEVRATLAARGMEIPQSTWFVGAERNTASNAVTFFDEDAVPPTHRAQYARVRASIETARALEAHERCRRFESAPTWFGPAAALLHVESRTVDLAQPRPECGHATNAFCVVGRRTRTRGAFLDRRCFLVSYDPTADAEGEILTRLLGAVVPVVAGINLEYYFGYVDPVGYGSGTKLPHNVASLLGVMEGTTGDLRTGLPWQMVEIHEPVRLSIVVECPPARLRTTLAALPAFARLVRNHWVRLACLDPDSHALWEVWGDDLLEFQPERRTPEAYGSSVAIYGGLREHLPFVRIRSEGSP